MFCFYSLFTHWAGINNAMNFIPIFTCIEIRFWGKMCWLCWSIRTYLFISYFIKKKKPSKRPANMISIGRLKHFTNLKDLHV